MEKSNRQLNSKERIRKNYKASKARDVEMDLQATTSRSSNLAIQVDSKNPHNLLTTVSKAGQQVKTVLTTMYEPKFEACQSLSDVDTQNSGSSYWFALGMGTQISIEDHTNHPNKAKVPSTDITSTS